MEAEILKKPVVRCKNCEGKKVIITSTKSVPGKHYHCQNCGHQWQDRTVRKYRQRRSLSESLLTEILNRKNQLHRQDRFFIEKMNEQGKTSIKYHNRLLRIAHKIGLDPRDLQ